MEFAVTAKIRNKHLFVAVEKMGSQSALAEHLNVSAQQIGKWLNLEATPDLQTRREFWQEKIGEKLFALTYRALDEIFPEELRTDKFFLKQKKEFTKFVECAPNQLAGLVPKQIESADVEFDKKQLQTEIAKTLGTLTEREEKVIKQLYGFEGEPKTLEDVACEFAVTRERIRQIEAKALRKLRHPDRARKLQPFTNL